MAHLVEVAPDESISSIRAKLTSSEERDVILVVPRHTKALQSVIGARVLARAAVEYRLRVAVVSRDGAVRRHVGEAGISVFGQVSAAEKARRWRTPAEPSAPTRAPVKVNRSVAESQRPDQRSWAERFVGVLLLALLLAAIGAFTVFLIPEATVEVQPATQTFAAEVRLAVSIDITAIDYEHVAIPGKVASTLVQGTWSQPTTSRVDSADQRATGAVIIINQSSSAVAIPSGTIVSTGSGVPVRFRTTAEAPLPAQKGATVTVPVEAVDAGPAGNVGAYLINTMQGPLASQCTVINEQPTEGGSVRQVGVVTEADRERLRTGLRQRLITEGHNAIQNLIEPGEIAPYETLRQTDEFPEAWDKMLNEEADQLSLTLRVEYAETSFRMSDVNSIAMAGLQGVVPEGYELDGGNLRYEVTSVLVDEQGNLSLVAVATGDAVARVDGAEVRSLVQGLTPDQAREALSALPLAAPVSVELVPAWMGTLPRFGFRIRVNVLPPAAQE
ncbi:MAG: baseplate J/gp47 family protein [Anaerolineae bacterium]